MKVLGIFLIIVGIVLAISSNALEDMNQGVAVYDGNVLEELEEGQSIEDLKPSGYMARNQEGIEVAEVLNVVGIVAAVLGVIIFIIGCLNKAGKSQEYDY